MDRPEELSAVSNSDLLIFLSLLASIEVKISSMADFNESVVDESVDVELEVVVSVDDVVSRLNK